MRQSSRRHRARQEAALAADGVDDPEDDDEDEDPDPDPDPEVDDPEVEDEDDEPSDEDDAEAVDAFAAGTVDELEPLRLSVR